MAKMHLWSHHKKSEASSQKRDDKKIAKEQKRQQKKGRKDKSKGQEQQQEQNLNEVQDASKDGDEGDEGPTQSDGEHDDSKDAHSDNEDAHSDNEDVHSHNEDVHSDNEDAHSDNEEAHSDNEDAHNNNEKDTISDTIEEEQQSPARSSHSEDSQVLDVNAETHDTSTPFLPQVEEAVAVNVKPYEKSIPSFGHNGQSQVTHYVQKPNIPNQFDGGMQVLQGLVDHHQGTQGLSDRQSKILRGVGKGIAHITMGAVDAVNQVNQQKKRASGQGYMEGRHWCGHRAV